VSAEIDRHIPEEILEEFAMEMLSEPACALWEEHLLICARCRDRVAETDEYIRVMKGAAAAIGDPPLGENAPPTTEFRNRRGLAKPMIAAARVAHA
jgi:hypothetical protein